MSPLLFLAVVLAGAVGAGLRYAVDVAVTAVAGRIFPWGILVANVTGSFALGLVTGIAPSEAILQIVGTGMLGGYTTFSTVSVASVLLLEDREYRRGIANAIGTLALTMAAAFVGLALGGVVG